MRPAPPAVPHDESQPPPAGHPGAKALRRVAFMLVLFTLPGVLILTGVVPMPAGAGTVPMLALLWVALGLFIPPAMLWTSARPIAAYLEHFPALRRVVGACLLVAGAVMGVMGWLAATDPSVQSRRVGLPFVLMAVMIAGGWKMLRGTPSPPSG